MCPSSSALVCAVWPRLFCITYACFRGCPGQHCFECFSLAITSFCDSSRVNHLRMQRWCFSANVHLHPAYLACITYAMRTSCFTVDASMDYVNCASFCNGFMLISFVFHTHHGSFPFACCVHCVNFWCAFVCEMYCVHMTKSMGEAPFAHHAYIFVASG